MNYAFIRREEDKYEGRTSEFFQFCMILKGMNVIHKTSHKDVDKWEAFRGDHQRAYAILNGTDNKYRAESI